MGEYSGYIGYLKLQGPDIENGILGARESANALMAFDTALRYLLGQKDPTFLNANFEIPVKVREGSWEALIPQTITDWLIAGGGVFITTGAAKVASNTFKDKDLAALARDGVKLLQGVVKIAKHVGRLGDSKAAKGVRFLNNNTEVEIPNDEGVYIRTTREELETYVKMPHKMVEEIVQFLGQERILTVGEVDANGVTHEEIITHSQRKIFIAAEEEEADQGVILPELAHGQYVELVGLATRGNKLTNTIGFKYQDHVLTCMPSGAPITAFKAGLFRQCLIKGRIIRSRDPMIKRDAPKIVFEQLTPIEDGGDQVGLFPASID